MAKREYKTAGGKSIDFDTLSLKGEETIAVGNMNVNARGDKLGTGGEIVKPREEVMADYYRIHNGTIPEDKTIADPDEPNIIVDKPMTADAAPELVPDEQVSEPVITSDQLAEALAETAAEVKEEPALRSTAAEVMAPVEPTVSNMSVPTEEKPIVKIPDEEQIDPLPPVEEEKPQGGLASAVAKVKTTKPVVKEKTKAQEEKAKGGVKRL